MLFFYSEHVDLSNRSASDVTRYKMRLMRVINYWVKTTQVDSRTVVDLLENSMSVRKHSITICSVVMNSVRGSKQVYHEELTKRNTGH